MREFIIQENEANQRFDKYLKKLLVNASTGFLYKMLRKKNITLDGKKATGKEMLQKGSRVHVFFSEETILKFMQNGKTLEDEYVRLKNLSMKGLHVIYEDKDILVADKPANMLSQKAKEQDVSANEYLLGYLIREEALTLKEFQTFRPSVCNRLDRNTTGLLLMGKSLSGSQMLSLALKERTIQKYYRAIVYGHVTTAEHLSGWLLKDERTNKVKILSEEKDGASYIETAYEPIACGDNVTLLEIHLITGKTHQIRAHLSSISCPIVGDMKYGDEAVNQKYHKQYQVTHQLLHAYRLKMPDDRTFIAPMPEVFRKIIH